MNKEINNDTATPDRLIPFNRWTELHPWPPIGGLRHIRFYAVEKGATDCFVKKGRRVLILERKFLEWASRNDKAKALACPKLRPKMSV